MTDELQDLYQELILDHGRRRPRNRRRIENADHSAEGYNPLCGDHFTIFLKLDGDVVTDVTFEGSGCAISTASASLMTESLKGRTIEEAKALFKKFHGFVTGANSESRMATGGKDNGPALGKLEVFSGVRQYPVRVKCATLAWHTVKAALEGHDNEVVSTE